MAEITKVYRQTLPAMRFIGKNYGNSKNTDWGANWGDAFANDVFGKIEKASGGEAANHALFEDSNAYLGLYYRNAATGEHDAWVGMFAPVGTTVDEGLGYIDFAAQDIGVCWLYGKQGEVYQLVPQCADQLAAAGMVIKTDAHGPVGFFERDQCPRFTTPDDKGNVIVDYCYFVE